MVNDLILANWRLSVAGAFGLAITLACFVTCVYALWRASRRVDPDMPIYLLLAASSIFGIVWFVLLLTGVTGTTLLWRLWSRVVFVAPYLAIGSVVVIRMMKYTNGKRPR